jgi:hypothetical protein
MCNAWNHHRKCRCGWGGEGHLGGSSGLLGLSTRSDPFLLTGRVKTSNGSSITSFVIPNARCPVCSEQVYFYQSPHGGRVFFDELGWPWPKHPCTDNDGHRKSTKPINWIGDDINQLALFYIHEWGDDGYFPLICTNTKGSKQLGGEFLYMLEGEKKRHSVWLNLDSPIYIRENALFFIKDVDSLSNKYELKFCYKKRGNKAVDTEIIPAHINNLIRPVLKDGRIVFKDFTGISVGKKKLLPHGTVQIKKKPSTTPASQSETWCKYCYVRFSIKGEAINHQKGCGLTLDKCAFCSKPIPRHQIKTHEPACYQRLQKMPNDGDSEK